MNYKTLELIEINRNNPTREEIYPYTTRLGLRILELIDDARTRGNNPSPELIHQIVTMYETFEQYEHDGYGNVEPPEISAVFAHLNLDAALQTLSDIYLDLIATFLATQPK